MSGQSRGLVAVTPRSLSTGGHPALAPIVDAGFELAFPSPGATPTPAQQLAVIPRCVGYLAGVEPITAELLDASPRLQVISRNGVGTDAIDLVAAQRRGVTVVNAPGANSQGVAELAIALMLASVRSVAWSDAGLKSGEWKRREGVEISGRTLGVIGCGNIGGRVARMAVGLGMSVLGVDQLETEELRALKGFRYVNLAEMLSHADVVSLHCPPAERPVIGRDELSLMSPGVHVVNTARASLVDEQALLEALEQGSVGGFATDVFEVEPPPRSAILEHPRVTATPHVGGYTRESVHRAACEAVVNLLTVLEGG